MRRSRRVASLFTIGRKIVSFERVVHVDDQIAGVESRNVEASVSTISMSVHSSSSRSTFAMLSRPDDDEFRHDLDPDGATEWKARRHEKRTCFPAPEIDEGCSFDGGTG